MDLVSIFRSVWRHKFVTIPVILFTCLGVFYVMAIKQPVYQASSSFALVYPPPAPTAAQIAADPKLAKINTSNPLLGYSDPSAITQIIISLVGTPNSQKALEQAGAGTQWQVAPSAYSGYIVTVTGVGPTPKAAVLSSNLVTKAAENALLKIQVNQGVNSTYMIKGYPLQIPNQAAQKLSGKLRSLVAVIALGAILLFIAVSIAQAIAPGTRQPEPSTVNGLRSRSAANRRPLDQMEPVESVGRFRFQSK